MPKFFGWSNAKQVHLAQKVTQTGNPVSIQTSVNPLQFAWHKYERGFMIQAQLNAAKLAAVTLPSVAYQVRLRFRFAAAA